MQECRLARSTGAHDADELARLNLERDVTQDGVGIAALPVELEESLRLNQGATHHGLFTNRTSFTPSLISESYMTNASAAVTPGPTSNFAR